MTRMRREYECGWRNGETDCALGLPPAYAAATDYGRGYEAGYLSANRDATPEVAGCVECVINAARGFGPSHHGHALCRVNASLASGGTRAHCTCGGCF